MALLLQTAMQAMFTILHLQSQYSGTPDLDYFYMKNINYSNNVFECCNSAGEIFNTPAAEKFGNVNVTITNNYVMYAGHGLASQRPVKCGNLYAGTRYRSNLYFDEALIANNYVVFPVITALMDACQWSDDMNPIIYRDNVYVLYTPGNLIGVSESIPECYQPTMVYPFSERALQMVVKKGYETNGTYYYTDEAYWPEVAEGAYYKAKPVIEFETDAES